MGPSVLACSGLRSVLNNVVSVMRRVATLKLKLSQGHRARISLFGLFVLGV